ncbi:MAG: hypothetical protein KatS3mg008_0103 [Acidimicrobiales bacterium]|nr:MAG: hypothetical protein KatS3mg008_0103 [Acidimicrobiales bacterium]
MHFERWLNRSQPQTLYIATILFYASAVITVLTGGVASPLGLLFVALEVAAGLGIANERKWGYAIGVAVTGLAVALLALAVLTRPRLLFDVTVWIASVFPIARFALLVHPLSREYQRVWFR